MSDNPKVSVIIPLYNQKRYLNTCVHSICAQTYQNLEIIVVNDGSTDDSLARAQKLAEGDERIVVLDKENGGTASARRHGLLAATGAFVAFVDNDDVLPPRSIEIMLGHATSTGGDVVVGGVTKILGVIKKRHIDRGLPFPCNRLITQPELFDKHYVAFFGVNELMVGMWGRLYRKSVIDKAMQETDLFTDDLRLMGDDEYFNLKLFPYLQSMYRTDEEVYYYRYGGTVDNFNSHFTDLFKLSDLRLKLLDQYHYEAGYQPLFIEYMACFFYHAQQMLEFKRADKAGVMDYFKQELEHRELFPRFVAYFTEHPIQSVGVNLMLSGDYEAMYNHANQTMLQRTGTMRYKTMRFIYKLINKCC